MLPSAVAVTLDPTYSNVIESEVTPLTFSPLKLMKLKSSSSCSPELVCSSMLLSFIMSADIRMPARLRIVHLLHLNVAGHRKHSGLAGYVVLHDAILRPRDGELLIADRLNLVIGEDRVGVGVARACDGSDANAASRRE